MLIRRETIFFLLFVLMGTGFGIIFDFFRAIRKVKKVKTEIVTLQDIIYFIIIGIILVIVVINIPAETFRLYLIIAIFLGVIIYALLIKNTVRNLFIKLIKASDTIVDFIFAPLKLQIMFWRKIYKKIKKYVKSCCKRKGYMIKWNHKKVNFGKTEGKLHKEQKKEESWKNGKFFGFKTK